MALHADPVAALQRPLDAGALWVGKTNLDPFATGPVATRSLYGRPSWVADAQRISGGSSSGSAVAVARGIVAFSLGTDTTAQRLRRRALGGPQPGPAHLRRGTGVTTEVCVQTSMREANDRGYTCLIVSDATASYFPAFKRAALEMITAQGAIIGWCATSADLLSTLN